MDQEGNKYRMCSGIDGGAIVESNWTVVEGKNTGKANATTDEEQATKEIEAKYKKQRESGYWDNIKNIDKTTFFSPMLAQKYLDYKDDINWKEGVYVSPKMDGLRCVITKDGCFSRNGKRFVSFPHIPRELTKIFKDRPDAIFDGEIYTHTFANNFNKIISLAKKTKPTDDDLVESEKYLQYWVFDFPSSNLPFAGRMDVLDDIFDTHLKKNKWIKRCPHTLIHSSEKLETKLADFIADGYEGLMVNVANAPYENKRSDGLLKYKLFVDEEVEILDIEPGDGNRAGMFGRAICRRDNGVEFEANSRGDEELYIRLLKEKKEVIGKRATVRYQNLTPDEKPRFGVIVAIRDYE